MGSIHGPDGWEGAGGERGAGGASADLWRVELWTEFVCCGTGLTMWLCLEAWSLQR